MFNGKLYDFRYYNRALTETEITDIYTNNAIFGDEVLQMPLSGKSVTLDGRLNANVYGEFNGSSQYYEIPYTPTLNTPQFTVTAWLYTTGGAGTWRSAFTSRNYTGGATQGWMLYVSQSDKYQFCLLYTSPSPRD